MQRCTVPFSNPIIDEHLRYMYDPISIGLPVKLMMTKKYFMLINLPALIAVQHSLNVELGSELKLIELNSFSFIYLTNDNFFFNYTLFRLH